MRNYGLIGKDISYSFSQNYFSIKFKDENITDAKYQNFDIQNIENFKSNILTTKGLSGLNVTIPYKESIIPHIKKHHKKALILGTGGASKAIAYVLKQLNIQFHFVSRQQSKAVSYTYDTLTEAIINEHQIIINCSPVGTFPDVNEAPNIPYGGLSKKHVLFDLIYNPSQTVFLKHGKNHGATTINGYDMLVFQAEKSWKIWNKNL